jgi:hypothetical protein
MNSNETRFFKRKAFVISFDCLTKVMQEILDDSSLEIEMDYPVISMYSRGSDVIVSEDTIIDRIGFHLKEDISKCWVYFDLEEAYFVCDS